MFWKNKIQQQGNENIDNNAGTLKRGHQLLCQYCHPFRMGYSSKEKVQK